MEHILSEIERVSNEMLYTAQKHSAWVQFVGRLEILCSDPRLNIPDRLASLFDEMREYQDDDFTLGDARRLHGMIEAIAFLARSPDEQSDKLLVEFDLAPDDKARLLLLCEQMRKIIWSAEIFDDAHRVRLLNRVSAIETQVHKSKGNLDVILAGIVDFGDAAGKFGERVKPLTDRMREIGLVARKSSKDYDKIPAPDEVRRLPKPETDEAE